MHSFFNAIYEFALRLGGPGVFTIAFLDSLIFLPPSMNDALLVLMVNRYKAQMPYFVAMATFGSVAGCYVLYYLAERGGERFLDRRLQRSRLDRALGLYRRHGLLALMIPALLPPPAPFKLFVLAAGLANVRAWQFVVAIAVARGARYLALGLLAVNYGDAAVTLMSTRGKEVALWVVTALVLAVIVWWLWKRQQPLDEAA